MSQALQLVDEREPYNRQQLDLLKRTIAAGLDDNEFGLLVEVAKRTGLDLFQRQLYGIKRGGKMTLQTGIDGYRLLAARTGQLAGIDDALYDDETGKRPGRASVTVWRLVQGQRVPFTATARWSEYYQSAGGMWDKMPFLMLGKCAEALALRKAFPAELSGVYTREEMAQADNDEPMVDAAPQAGGRYNEQHTTVSVLAGMRDDAISLQKLYDRFKATGFPASEWTRAKRDFTGDLAKLENYVTMREHDAKTLREQEQARTAAEGNEDALFGLEAGGRN